MAKLLVLMVKLVGTSDLDLMFYTTE